MAVQVGQKAPDFSLVTSEKETVSLSDYEGKNLLLLFFPMAYTSVCTAELCQTRDNLSEYNDMNTDVLAISVDSPFVLDRFKQDNNLNFPLASDFNKDASQAYGAYHETFPAFDLKGVSKRSAFVIDKEGEVRYAEILDNPGEMPNFDKINQTIESL